MDILCSFLASADDTKKYLTSKNVCNLFTVLLLHRSHKCLLAFVSKSSDAQHSVTVLF